MTVFRGAIHLLRTIDGLGRADLAFSAPTSDDGRTTTAATAHLEEVS